MIVPGESIDVDNVDPENPTMLFEVGSWWNPSDPEVIIGATTTTAQKRKVGYVEIDGDTGGVTKYGISQANHRNVSVKDLNLDQAMAIYYSDYWLAARCEQMSDPIAASKVDACVNFDVYGGATLLQKAVGAAQDGQIGPKTLQLVSCARERSLVENFSELRAAKYRAIVTAKPSQSKFLNGWLRRTDEVEHFSLSLIDPNL